MGRVGEGGRSGWRWNCCAERASRKKQRQKPRGKTALEGNGTGWIIRSMSNSMVTGSKEVCSQENLVAADVTYRFFFLFFRILPVTVISLSLLFWFNRLVFVLFFGFLVQGAKGDAIFPWNFRNEICFAYACLVGGLIHRSGGLCPAAVSRQISLFRTI